MEIYIKVTDCRGKLPAWYNREKSNEYLMDGNEICAEGECGFYLRGTAFTSKSAAEKAAVRAKALMAARGHLDPKVKFFTYDGPDFVETAID